MSSVNGQDLDVQLVLQRGVTINGSVVFEGAPPAPADLQTLVFRLVPPGSGGMIMNTRRVVSMRREDSRSWTSRPMHINS